jgi:Ca2+-binding RTX toxin-like protein
MTRQPSRPTFRPAVEALEAREVPATLIELTGIAQQAAAAANTVVAVARHGSDLVITGTPQDDHVTVTPVGRGAIRLDIQSGAGPAASQVVPLTGLHRLIFVGGDGNDAFVNRTALDSVGYGGNGNDLLVGGAGNDQFDGGAGDDDLRGGAGNDTLWGGPGSNRLDGGTGVNIIDGVVTPAQPGQVRGRPPAAG